MPPTEGNHIGSKLPEGYERKGIMFTLSETFLNQLDHYCFEHDVSRASVIRQAIATHIDYDLLNEPQPDRRRKYESPTHRKAAQKARDKLKRQLVRKVQDSLQNGNTEAALEDLRKSLSDGVVV